MNKQLIFILTLIFSAILMAESVWAVNYLAASRNAATPSFSANGPQLRLETVDKTVKIGQPFKVAIILDPKGAQIQALDAKLVFDKNIVNVTQITPLVTAKDADYPLNEFNNGLGTLALSLILPEEPIATVSSVAEVTFSPVQAGNTAIKLLFTPGNTKDSNVVLFNDTKDSLSQVTNVQISVEQ